MSTLIIAVITFIACGMAIPFLLLLLRGLSFYTEVQECRAKVYMLFGKVLAVIHEPGLHFLWVEIGPQVILVPFFGAVYEVDGRLDQQYLRSQPVNSEEGTPMGIGAWYEMRVAEPVEFLFRNTDPRGSLKANISNAVVRCLSNMPLEHLLQDRHAMSRKVREEVSPKAAAWGYQLGSVYIRKVHFRDAHMIKQIEQKVINRLTKVTSAIRQLGDNQVNIIKSAAEREASQEFARAAATRPYVVGLALQEIGRDREILHALFEILETEKMLEGKVDLTLIPAGDKGAWLSSLLAAQPQAMQQ